LPTHIGVAASLRTVTVQRWDGEASGRRDGEASGRRDGARGGAILVYRKILNGECYRRRSPATIGIVPTLVDEVRAVAWFPDNGRSARPSGRHTRTQGWAA
jgi:hypothetical protein